MEDKAAKEEKKRRQVEDRAKATAQKKEEQLREKAKKLEEKAKKEEKRRQRKGLGSKPCLIDNLVIEELSTLGKKVRKFEYTYICNIYT